MNARSERRKESSEFAIAGGAFITPLPSNDDTGRDAVAVPLVALDLVPVLVLPSPPPLDVVAELVPPAEVDAPVAEVDVDCATAVVELELRSVAEEVAGLGELAELAELGETELLLLLVLVERSGAAEALDDDWPLFRELHHVTPESIFSNKDPGSLLVPAFLELQSRRLFRPC